MHPIDEIGRPLAALLGVFLLLVVGWAFLMAWLDTRDRDREAMRKHRERMRALAPPD